MPAPARAAGRVIAGTARGIRLAGPPGARPLADRVKETLFAILEPLVRGREFLDLYAGSGAAGIEALSRGAARAVFVDSDARAVEAIERNLAATGLGSVGAQVVRRTVAAWLGERVAARAGGPSSAGSPAGPFAAIVIDPPYVAADELDRALEAIETAGPDAVLARDGVAVAKHFWKRPPREGRLLRSVRVRRFGETSLTFLRWADEEDR